MATSESDLDWADHGALIFDWDGTLVDSHEANFLAMQEAVAPYGITLEKPWFYARTGTSSRELVRRLSELHRVELNIEGIAAARDAAFSRRLTQLALVDPVVAVLRAARGVVPVALATGGGRATVTAAARHLGLQHLFDAIVTRDDVDCGKPAPDLFLAAADLLAQHPAACLVFEDSDEGLAAAHAAGMDAVDVRGATRS